MIGLNFVPENDEFAEAAREYEAIWQAEGDRIAAAIEHATGLQFKEEAIRVTVYEGISQSYPDMKLRASYDKPTKTATLVHELLHRLSNEYMLDLPVKGEPLQLGLHKQIDLVLYDLWTDLYGKEFADGQVTIESNRVDMYKAAWEWALNLSRQQRAAAFGELREQCQSRLRKSN
jgi:hypothetical protein